MTDREQARWISELADGTMHRRSVQTYWIERALSAARRDGKIEETERTLKTFEDTDPDSLFVGWLRERLAALRAEQAKEER